jgi:hypothetical protein
MGAHRHQPAGNLLNLTQADGLGYRPERTFGAAIVVRQFGATIGRHCRPNGPTG